MVLSCAIVHTPMSIEVTEAAKDLIAARFDPVGARPLRRTIQSMIGRPTVCETSSIPGVGDIVAADVDAGGWFTKTTGVNPEPRKKETICA